MHYKVEGVGVLSSEVKPDELSGIDTVSEKIADFESLRATTSKTLTDILSVLNKFCDVPVSAVLFKPGHLSEHDFLLNTTSQSDDDVKAQLHQIGDAVKFSETTADISNSDERLIAADTQILTSFSDFKFVIIAPIIGHEYDVIGGLVLADIKPRQLSKQQNALVGLQANQMTREILFRHTLNEEIKLHQKIADNERMLRLVLDNAPSMIWFKDDKNNILKTNQHVAESMGIPKDQIEGRNVSEFFPKDIAEMYHAEDLRVIESGEPRLGAVMKYVFQNGDVTWTTRDKIPYTDPETKERFVLNIATDITLLRKIKKQALEDAERFEFVANESLVGLWDWPLNGVGDIWWSPVYHRMMGDPDRQLKPDITHFHKVIHREDLNRLDICLKNHFKDRKAFSIECRLKDLEKGYRWYLIMGQSRWNNEGRCERLMGSLMDIDALKTIQLEYTIEHRQLLEANQELDRFAYIASHDLKAPLRGMSNLIEWIGDDVAAGQNESVAEKLRLLSIRVQRMEMLLKDILSFSRAGKNKGVIETVSVRDLTEDIVEWLSLPEGLKVNLVEPLPVLKIHKTPLEQIILNLISNAVKYHDKSDGMVELSCKETQNNYIFSVMDDGPGIPDEFQNSVFDPFKRLVSRDDIEGSGLGLSIVRKMVKSLNGDVWLEGNSESRGTIVRFMVPKRDLNENNGI